MENKKGWELVYNHLVKLIEGENNFLMHIATVYVTITAFSFYAYSSSNFKGYYKYMFPLSVWGLSVFVIMIIANSRSWRKTYIYSIKVAQRALLGDKKINSKESIVELAKGQFSKGHDRYIYTSKDTLIGYIIIMLSSTHLFVFLDAIINNVFIILLICAFCALMFVYFFIWYVKKRTKRFEDERNDDKEPKIPYIINMWEE